MTTPAKIGAIDCGSNAIRFSIYSVRDNRLSAPRLYRFPVRLGVGTFHDGSLAEKDIAAAVVAFNKIADLTRTENLASVTGVATSAIREATNCDDFLRTIREKTGIKIRTISGKEEARLIALGIKAAHNSSSEFLVIDVGGGSTEIIHCDGNGTITQTLSLKLGAVRLAQLVKMPGTYTQSDSDTLTQVIADTLLPHSKQFHLSAKSKVLAAGGTASAITDAISTTKSDNSPNVSREDIKKLIAELRNVPIRDYTNIPAERAPIIFPGALIFHQIMTFLKIPQFEYTRAGLREGVAWTALQSLL